MFFFVFSGMVSESCWDPTFLGMSLLFCNSGLSTSLDGSLRTVPVEWHPNERCVFLTAMWYVKKKAPKVGLFHLGFSFTLPACLLVV